MHLFTVCFLIFFVSDTGLSHPVAKRGLDRGGVNTDVDLSLKQARRPRSTSFRTRYNLYSNRESIATVENAPRGEVDPVQPMETVYRIDALRAFLIPQDSVEVIVGTSQPAGDVCDDQAFLVDVDESRIPNSLTMVDCSRSCHSCTGQVRAVSASLEILRKYQTTTKRQVFRQENLYVDFLCVCDTSGSLVDDQPLTFNNQPNPAIRELVYSISEVQRSVQSATDSQPEEPTSPQETPTGALCAHRVLKDFSESVDESRVPSFLPELDCSQSCGSCDGDVLPVSTSIQVLQRVSTEDLFKQKSVPLTVACVCKPRDVAIVKYKYSMTPAYFDMSAITVQEPMLHPIDNRGTLCSKQVPGNNAIDENRIPSTLVQMDCSNSCTSCQGLVRPIRQNLNVLRKHAFNGQIVYVHETTQVTIACACDLTAPTEGDSVQEPSSSMTTHLSSHQLAYLIQAVEQVESNTDETPNLLEESATSGEICQDAKAVRDIDDHRIPSSIVAVDCNAPESCQACSGARRPVLLTIPNAMQITSANFFEQTTIQVPIACVCD